MEPASISQTPGRPGAGTALWIVATLVSVPAGMAVMNTLEPTKMKWLRMAFPALLFVFQAAALALAGRSRPRLMVLGLSLVLGAAFCYREMLPSDWSQWIRIAIYGLFFGVAWAGALAQNGKQAALWIVLGTAGVVAGSWFGNEVYRGTRTSISTSEMRRVATALGLSMGILAFTVPLIWSFFRAPARAAAGTLRAPARQRAPQSRLTAGQLALAIAGLYLLVLGGGTIYRAVQLEAQAEQRGPQSAREFVLDRRRDKSEAYPGNALDLGALNYVLAGACILVGLGLFLRMNAARYAFQIVAPLGALACASVFAQKYWQDDIPKTVLLGLPFGILVFAIGRRSAIAAATLEKDGTSAEMCAGTRGMYWAIGLLAVAFLAYFSIKMDRPMRTHGYGARAYGNHLSALNEYVKHLAVTYVLLWHALPGLLAAAIPSGTGAEAPPVDVKAP